MKVSKTEAGDHMVRLTGVDPEAHPEAHPGAHPGVLGSSAPNRLKPLLYFSFHDRNNTDQSQLQSPIRFTIRIMKKKSDIQEKSIEEESLGSPLSSP